MDNHWKHSEGLKQDNILGEVLFEMLLDHGGTSIFNYHYFSIEALNV